MTANQHLVDLQVLTTLAAICAAILQIISRIHRLQATHNDIPLKQDIFVVDQYNDLLRLEQVGMDCHRRERAEWDFRPQL